MREWYLTDKERADKSEARGANKDHSCTRHYRNSRVVQVALLNAHKESGQLSLIQLEMLDYIHLLHQKKGQA